MTSLRSIAIAAVVLPISSVASAQQPAVASGFVVEARLPAASVDLPAGAADLPLPAPPAGLLLGFRTGAATVGLEFGLAIAEVNQGTTTVLSFKAMPTLRYDMWRSTDQRVRFNALAAVGVGRSFAQTGPDGALQVGTTLLPLRIGVGGDYFPHPNFAFGLDLTYEGLFVLASATKPSGGSVEFALHRIGASFRATLVLD